MDRGGYMQQSNNCSGCQEQEKQENPVPLTYPEILHFLV
jgi:hypothetical protein